MSITTYNNSPILSPRLLCTAFCNFKQSFQLVFTKQRCAKYNNTSILLESYLLVSQPFWLDMNVEQTIVKYLTMSTSKLIVSTELHITSTVFNSPL